MGLFERMKQRLRGTTARDRLCSELCAMGLDARLVERGQPEETVTAGLVGTSLGLVEVPESPIRWINLIEHLASRYAPAAFTNIYLAPDVGVPDGGYVVLNTLPIRSAVVHGRVVDVQWQLDFVGTKAVAAREHAWNEDRKNGLLARLNGDARLRDILIRSDHDVAVRSVPGCRCWAMSSGSCQDDRRGSKTPQFAPSEEQWDSYQAIARALLQPGREEGSTGTAEPDGTAVP